MQVQGFQRCQPFAKGLHKLKCLEQEQRPKFVVCMQLVKIQEEMKTIHALQMKTWTAEQATKKLDGYQQMQQQYKQAASGGAEAESKAAGMTEAQLADYQERAGRFGLASLEEVAAAASKEGVVWLDVRSGRFNIIASAGSKFIPNVSL